MYKKIMLNLLLLPCMVFSKSDRDCQIEQLKNAQRDKEEEIALIVKAIDEKGDLIDNILLKFQDLYPSLSAEYRENLGKTLDVFVDNLQEAIAQRKSITSLMSNEFTHDDDYKFTIKRIKYLAIRHALESMNLYKLIEQYEKCLQELFETNNKLEELQQ